MAPGAMVHDATRRCSQSGASLQHKSCPFSWPNCRHKTTTSDKRTDTLIELSCADRHSPCDAFGYKARQIGNCVGETLLHFYSLTSTHQYTNRRYGHTHACATHRSQVDAHGCIAHTIRGDHPSPQQPNLDMMIFLARSLTAWDADLVLEGADDVLDVCLGFKGLVEEGVIRRCCLLHAVRQICDRSRSNAGVHFNLHVHRHWLGAR